MLLKMIALLVAMASLNPLAAEGRWKRVWRGSVAALAVGSSADAWSSNGAMETNPILRSRGGQFGHKAVGLKLGIGTGVVLAQWQLAKRSKKPESVYKAGAITNFAMAGVFAGVAVRNHQILSR